jgi:hypothetical protein
MNQLLTFETAYKQLKPSERVFVDGYVSDLETLAIRTGEKLQNLLGKIEIDENDERSQYMLSLALVRAAIVERVKEIAEELELSVHKTLKELRNMAYSSMGNYWWVDEGGTPHLDLGRCTPEQWSAIKSIEIDQKATGSVKTKITLHDKTANLVNLMKYQGLLTDEHWRAENAREIRPEKIDDVKTVDEAAQLYAKQING